MPRINHNHLFLMGFAYYLVLPVAVGRWEMLAEMPGMAIWHGNFQRLGADAFAFYWPTVAGMFVAFYAGSMSAALVPKTRLHSASGFRLMRRNKVLMWGVASLLVVTITFILVRNIELVLTGYRRGYDQRLLGMLATVLMFSLFMAIYLKLLKRHPLVARTFVGITFGCAVLMLSLGARMYALIALIAFLLYVTRSPSRAGPKLLTLFLLGSAVVFLALAIGLWRVGLEIRPELILYIFIAEPTFTWLSTSSFLANNLQSLDALHVPANFASSFVNFIPSMLLENKSELIVRVADSFPYESPFGADSIFVSSVGNFGWFGAILYMYGVGLGYSVARLLANDLPFFRAYYIIIAALLPFQFFRDNFAILNKQLFWNLLLLPGLVVLVSRLVVHPRVVPGDPPGREVVITFRLPKVRAERGSRGDA